ncbi:MAG: hypothetical protein ACJ8CX_04105, partial [Microvirga sp.]
MPGATFADAARQVPGDPCPERDGAQGRQIKVGRDFEPHLTLPIFAGCESPVLGWHRRPAKAAVEFREAFGLGVTLRQRRDSGC